MMDERRWRRRPETVIPISRGRVIFTFILLFVIALLILIRLVQIQIIMHEQFAERAERQYKLPRKIEPNRGRILDRRGKELAISLSNYYSVGIRPGEIKNAGKLARELAAVLDMPVKSVLADIRNHRGFFFLKRKVGPDVARQIRAFADPAVDLRREPKRAYPYGQVGGQVVGFVDMENKGLGGIELVYNDLLTGVPGQEVLQKYGIRREIVDINYPYKKAVDGGTIVLSIDINAQAIAEEELAAAVEKYDARGGMIVITRPATGEILAIASIPRFNPNDYNKSNKTARQNLAVTAAYEPGSTFKVIPFSGLIERNLVQLDEPVFCENGRFRVADRIIRDAHPYDTLTVKEVLAKSSNIGTVKLTSRLKNNDFYTLIRSYGFDQKTGIPLNGESRGLLKPPSRWSGVSQANISIGQGIGVTALQMAMAFGAIANNGFLMKPMLVLSTTDRENRTELFEPTVIRRVIRPSTAWALRVMLAEAVENGTGKRARIEGVRVSGKTGTAQKVDTENGRYFQDRYVSSFIGFLPMDRPELLAVVVVDDPKGQHYGGVVAAPVFRRVMEKLLLTLPRRDPVLVEEDDDLAEKREEIRTVPSLVSLPREEAEKVLERTGLVAVWEGEGEVVIGQETPPGTAVKPGSRVQVVLGRCAAKSAVVTVPDLKGMDLRDAVAVLSRLGLRVEIDGSGLVADQAPRAGASLKIGQSCRLKARVNGRRGS